MFTNDRACLPRRGADRGYPCFSQRDHHDGRDSGVPARLIIVVQMCVTAQRAYVGTSEFNSIAAAPESRLFSETSFKCRGLSRVHGTGHGLSCCT